MRSLALALLLAVAGCPGALDREAIGDDDYGGGSGAGQSPEHECEFASDCVAAGPKCCDCPTHAVPITDPAARACSDVDCPTPSCGSPMQAACSAGRCVLECAPVACDPGLACDSGFATDANGCLVCACAGTDGAGSECSIDSECARVDEDCCGCERGGNDTAIPANKVAQHEADLMCPANPSCSEVDTCAPDLAARCVQGACALVSGALPPDACGRADLPACPAGQACTVNADEQASMYGVGVCR